MTKIFHPANGKREKKSKIEISKWVVSDFWSIVHVRVLGSRGTLTERVKVLWFGI